MITVLYGNEPYMIDYEKRKFIKPELQIEEFFSFDQNTMDFILQCPLFGDQKLCIVSVAKLEMIDNSFFQTFLKQQPDSCQVVIIADQVDKTRKIFKDLVKSKCVVACDKITDQKTFHAILKKEMGCLKGLAITESTYQEFIRRMNYAQQELSMYTLINQLKLLHAYNATITMEMVTSLVPDNEKDNVFLLANLIKQENISLLKHQCELITGTGDSDASFKALGALRKELTLALRNAMFPSLKWDEIGTFKRPTLAGFSIMKLLACLNTVESSLGILKSAAGKNRQQSILFETTIRMQMLLGNGNKM